jgi:hypothetical protein
MTYPLFCYVSSDMQDSSLLEVVIPAELPREFVFHDASCFFVAFSLTDFARTGFASSRLRRANNAASDSFLLATFYTEARAF